MSYDPHNPEATPIRSLRCSLGIHRWVAPEYGNRRPPHYYVGAIRVLHLVCERCGIEGQAPLSPGRLGK